MPPGIRPQNLNSAFLAAANQFRQKKPEPSHKQQVIHLYRHSLRVLLSWVIDRDIFNIEAEKIRERFNINRNITAAAATRLLHEGQDELFAHTHPDPYRVCFLPGGTKFMRNPPPPMEICFPDSEGNIDMDALPKDAPLYTYNPDMSVSKPETGRNAVGTVLVDFYKKNME